jgi:hypothetical protein
MDPDRRILLQVTLEDAAPGRRGVQHAHGRGRGEPPQIHPAQRQRRALPRHLTEEAASPVTQTPDPDRPDRAGRTPGGDAEVLPRLRDERDRGPRPAGCARRLEAGAPPDPLRDVRRWVPPRPRLLQVRRVVGDVLGSYHPHGDSAVYDALVRMVQPWALRYPLVDGQGNFGSPGNDPAAATGTPRRGWRQLAMEMVRDIDEETVDFKPNFDGRSQEPVILPSRFPNLLVNGSSGIAVGMATNIPPHNLTRGRRRDRVGAGAPGRLQGGVARGAHRTGEGSGLPDRRLHRGPRRDRGRLPHRPRVDHHARRWWTSRRTTAAAPVW